MRLFSHTYRTRTIINRSFYYFFILSQVGLSLMIGGIPLKLLKRVRLQNKSGYYEIVVIDGASTVYIPKLLFNHNLTLKPFQLDAICFSFLQFLIVIKFIEVVKIIEVFEELKINLL